MTLPRIAVVTTGGTIEAVGAGPHDLTGYMHSGRTLPPGALLSALDGNDVAELEHVPFRSLPSPSVTPGDWLELWRLLSKTAVRDVDGIVVTHGTNTLEETAFFLDLAWDLPVPLVLTGALRPPSALGADGPANLAAAVRVAAAPASRGRGVLVVLGTLVLAAAEATKVATDRGDAFAARDGGPLGFVDADGVVRYRAARPRAVVAPPELLDASGLPRVDVTVSYAGADGTVVDALAAAGAEGIVSAGTGAGHATAAEQEALARAEAGGVVVCRASRVPGGGVVTDPARPTWVAAGRLAPWQARTLLSVGLTRTREPGALQELFDRVQWGGAR